MKRALFFLLLAGCSSSTTWLRDGYVVQIRPADAEPVPGAVQVQWLNVAGFHLSFDGHAILLPPLYSKQPPGKVLLTELTIEKELIDRLLPKCDGVEAVLIGHAHYDHLLEVPYIMEKHATKATAYGCRTSLNLLAGSGVPESRRVEAKLDQWTWTPSRRARFAAFKSEHAPHLGRVIHLWTGKEEKPLTKPPKYAGQFLEGQPLAYLIEFLDEKERPVFTIYYQDAASGKGIGAPTIPHRPVDAAILCVPSWKNVDGYPEEILKKLRPKHVVLCHFDDFMCEPGKELEFLFHGETEEFLRETQRILKEHRIPATIWMPTPQARLNFATSSP